MPKKETIITIILTIILALFGYLIAQPQARKTFKFFWLNNYFNIVYLFLVVGFILIFQKKPKFITTKKIVYFIIFLPLAIIPIIRCYFKIPYIFCKVCPKQCPWGLIRKTIAPAFMLQNLSCRFWCFKLCPLGTIQDYQKRSVKKCITIPKWLKNIRYAFLAFAIFVIIMASQNKFKSDSFFFLGTFDPVIPTIIFFVLLFILAFFIPRIWCNLFCPIGTIGDIGLLGQKKCKNIIPNNSKKD